MSAGLPKIMKRIPDKSKWVSDPDDIDYSLNPLNNPEYTNDEELNYYSKQVTFTRNIDRETEIEAMNVLYQNFIDSQIELGRKLYGLTWWGVKQGIDCCDIGNPFDRPFKSIGWLAFERKNSIDKST